MALRSLLSGAVAASALMAATPASAAFQLTGYTYTPTDLYGGISVESLGLAQGGSTGMLQLSGIDTLTNAIVTYQSFCIDVSTALYTYSTYNQGSIDAGVVDGARQQRLAALISNAVPMIDAAATPGEASQIASAIGLGVWEILYEGTTSPYDIGNGNFSVYGDFLPLVGLANGFLANVTNGTWTGSPDQLMTLIDPTGGSQNQVFLASAGMPGAVPEPATWAMMVLGFGAVGMAMRRRRAPTVTYSMATASA